MQKCVMDPCVETSAEAQQSPPLLGPHHLHNPIAPPGAGQRPRALRCSSWCLALLGKDPESNTPDWLFPSSQSSPSHVLRTMESAGHSGGLFPLFR